jgi:hypothetical protein
MTTPATEEWKRAVSSRFGDLVADLEVSNTGKVRKITTKYEFKHDQKDCYKCVKRNKKTVYIHTLVAESFLGARPEGMVIDHINGDKSDNNLSNLRYVTVAENCKKGNKPLVTNPDGTVSVAQKANARHFRENTVRGLTSLRESMKKVEEENEVLKKQMEDAYRAINTLFMLYQAIPKA